MIRLLNVVLTVNIVALLPVANVAMAAPAEINLQTEGCGNLDNGYGPYNYNTVNGRAHWPIIQKHHFTESVQLLQHGHTGSIPSDLDYTLRAFPNQPLALYAMARYQLAHSYPQGATWNSVHYYPAECYFKRAMVFAPEDGVVRMIYGIYLQRKGQYKAALRRYRQAEKLIEPSRSAELHYDMGLLYFEMKNYAKAREQANLAYAKGYPLPGLRKQLESVGQWSGSPPKLESKGHDKKAK